jgi:hypothetical protein
LDWTGYDYTKSVMIGSSPADVYTDTTSDPAIVSNLALETGSCFFIGYMQMNTTNGSHFFFFICWFLCLLLNQVLAAGNLASMTQFFNFAPNDLAYNTFFPPAKCESAKKLTESYLELYGHALPFRR